MNQEASADRQREHLEVRPAPGLDQGYVQGRKLNDLSPQLTRITANAIGVGKERLHPSLRTCDYLALNQRRKRVAEWLQRVPENNLRVFDVGGRIQPYRPLLHGRLRNYFAVDIKKTGLVDAVAMGERLPFADATFDLVLCMACFATRKTRAK